jgi:hypothetical protein
LIGLLMREFRGVLIAMPAYAAVYLPYAGIKAAMVMGEGRAPDTLWSSPLFTVFAIAQKLGAHTAGREGGGAQPTSPRPIITCAPCVCVQRLPGTTSQSCAWRCAWGRRSGTSASPG